MFEILLSGILWTQNGPPKVALESGSFVVEGAGGKESVPLVSAKKKMLGINPINQNFQIVLGGKNLLFDGKTFKISSKGTKPLISQFKEIPVSGKIATKESNEALMKLVREKKRTLEFSAISGWESIKKDLYLLLRWDDSDKKPWLETVVKFDMTQSAPKPKLIGRFEGMSFAGGKSDDILTLRGPNLAILANNETGFGMARLSLDGSTASFKRLGNAVGKARMSAEGDVAWTLTPTSYGTNIMGIADLDQNDYREVSEFRGKMTEIVFPSYAKYKTDNKNSLINLKSGASMDMKDEFGQHPTSSGLLVWTPSRNPKEAYLLDPSFRKIAVWSASSAPLMTVKPKSTEGAKGTFVATKKPMTTAVSKTTKKPSQTVAKRKTNSKLKPIIEVTSKPSRSKRER